MADPKRPMNPYRKGRAAGEAHYAAFVAWRDAANASRDHSTPRPMRADNPYPKAPGRNCGWYQWSEGFSVGMKWAEAEERKAQSGLPRRPLDVR